MRQNKIESGPGAVQRPGIRVLVLALVLALCASGCAGWFGKKEEKSAGELAEEGAASFEAEKYDKALKSYERLRDWYPYSPHAKEAKLRIADAHFHLGQYDQALQAYQQYEQLHPNDSQIPYATYQMGMCHYERLRSIDRTQVPTRNALEVFLRLQSRFPDSQWARDAGEKIEKCRRNLAGHEFYVGEFYFKSEQYRAAMTRFETVVTQYPQVDEYTERARRYMDLCSRHLPGDAPEQRPTMDGWVQLPPIEVGWEGVN